MKRRNTSLLCNRLFHAFSVLNPKHPRIINQVGPLPSHLFLLQTKSRHFALFSFLADNSVSSSSGEKIAQAQIDSSSVDCFAISKSVIDLFSDLIRGKEKSSLNASSLKALLLNVSDIVPDISRRFRRLSVLKPEDVLQLLLAFEYECGKAGAGVRKVETLWEIFKSAGRQYYGFKHLHRSCEIMASILISEDMRREAEILVMEMGSEGDLLQYEETLSNLIEKYVGARDLERAVWLFDWMRGRNLLPSVSCFSTLIDLLLQMKKTQLAYQVCLDLVAIGTKLNNTEASIFDGVIELLCLDRKIQESRNLLRKLVVSGFEPSNSIVNKIASGYCEKQDFEDLLSFFAELKCPPDVLVGNKIIHVLCKRFGSDRANSFRKELEHLGFKADEITLGILIGWCCHEGDMQNAFVYLSEILSKGLKPDLFSYNALIGGVFKKRMWEHARLVLDEMVDSGITPNTSTFKILLAGYCGARRFVEAKAIVHEMVSHGLLDKSSLDNPLSQAFVVLGFDPLAVRLKRDNHAGLPKTEFFDDLGNGLYLDTDLDEYDKRVDTVLYSSAIPDFNSLIIWEYDHGNLKSALGLVHNMVRWGQELSYRVFSGLLMGLCASRSQIKASFNLLEKWPNLSNQLDEKALNFLVQECSKKGLTDKGRIIFQRMVQMRLPVHSETYTLLIKGLGKKGTNMNLRNCWIIAQNDKWLPRLDDCEDLWECLIVKKMLKEAVELLESMLVSFPRFQKEIYNMFLEKLCLMGFSCIAHSLVGKIVEQGYVLENSVYNHLIKGLCNEKRFSAAYSVLENIVVQKLVPCLDVSLILIPQLCRANKFEKAIALGEICLKRHSAYSSSIYYALIRGFCLMGKIAEAENLYRCMVSNGILPDEDVYHFLFQGHCQANDPRKVGEVLGILIRKNTSFSVASYRNFVRMMCMEGNFVSALSLKDFMLRRYNHDSLLVYNLLIFYLFQAKNCLLVNKVLDEMQQKGFLLDQVTYNFLVHGFFSCQDLSSSMHHLQTMISNGFRPNNRSLRAVITSFCGLGDLGKVLDLSREMESRGWVLGSVIQTKISECHISSGKIQEAKNFLIRLKGQDLVPSAINYDPLIYRFCYIGELDFAVDLLNLMLKKGNIPGSRSYDSVVLGFLKCNNLDKAMDFQTEMLDLGLKPSMDSWTMLIGKFCEKGQTAEAEMLIKWIIQLGETPTRQIYNIVIDQYRLEKNAVKASEIVQLMQKSGYEPDFETHWSLISNLSNSSGKDNKNTRGFLSRLLSGSGFSWKNDLKTNHGDNSEI